MGKGGIDADIGEAVGKEVVNEAEVTYRKMKC